MKNIFKNFKKMNYYFLVLFLLLNPNFSFAEIKFGNDKSRAVSEYVMIEVFDSHGFETERHKDITGDPHLVFKTKTVADNIAIFFDVILFSFKAALYSNIIDNSGLNSISKPIKKLTSLSLSLVSTKL